MISPLAKALWAFLVLSAPVSSAVTRLVTMDDNDPAIKYSDFGWVRGDLCVPCFQNVDIDQVYGGTWMNATQDIKRGVTPPTFFEFNFTGISVEILGMDQYLLAGIGRETPRPSCFNVTVDGVLDFVENAEYEDDFEDGEVTDYKVSLYQKTWDRTATHLIRVDLDGAVDPFQTLVLDSITYGIDVTNSQPPEASGSITSSSSSASATTTLTNQPGSQLNNKSQTSSASSRIGALIGATLGGCVFLLGIAVVVYFSMKRKNSISQTPEDVEQPYIPPPRDSTRTKSLLVLDVQNNSPERGSGHQHMLASAGQASGSGQQITLAGSPQTILSSASTQSVPPEYASAANTPIRFEKS